eukprot:scaffold154056_cov21-Tisochrysis_lutea.AAC.3
MIVPVRLSISVWVGRFSRCMRTCAGASLMVTSLSWSLAWAAGFLACDEGRQAKQAHVPSTWRQEVEGLVVGVVDCDLCNQTTIN